jgi:hypothetical protein
MDDPAAIVLVRPSVLVHPHDNPGMAWTYAHTKAILSETGLAAFIWVKAVF